MTERKLSGAGTVLVPAQPIVVLAALLDPVVLARIIPGTDHVEQAAPDTYRATLHLGVGRLRGDYHATLRLTPGPAPMTLELQGGSTGRLGAGSATGHVTLAQNGAATLVQWRYEGVVTGFVAFAAGAFLPTVSRLFVRRFFAAFADHLDQHQRSATAARAARSLETNPA